MAVPVEPHLVDYKTHLSTTSLKFDQFAGSGQLRQISRQSLFLPHDPLSRYYILCKLERPFSAVTAQPISQCSILASIIYLGGRSLSWSEHRARR